MNRVGVDIGGTFTDLVMETSGGYNRVGKVLSTPGDLVQGVLEAIEAAGVSLEDVELFVHGTTAGINSVLERRGARVALITTRGFRDTYIIGRGHRADMYDLRYRKPEPLLPREAIFEVDERLNADGSVLRKLDIESVELVAKSISEVDFDSVAVCLLHSYVSAAHELEVRRYLSKHLGSIPVVLVMRPLRNGESMSGPLRLWSPPISRRSFSLICGNLQRSSPDAASRFPSILCSQTVGLCPPARRPIKLC